MRAEAETNQFSEPIQNLLFENYTISNSLSLGPLHYQPER